MNLTKQIMSRKGISKCSGRVDVMDLNENIVSSHSYQNCSLRKKLLDEINMRYKNRVYYIIITPNVVFKNNNYELED